MMAADGRRTTADGRRTKDDGGRRRTTENDGGRRRTAEKRREAVCKENRLASPAASRCEEKSTEVLTTVVVRNLPRFFVIEDLVKVILSLKFAEADFDFINMHEDRKGGQNRGYAFVNWVSHSVAKRFSEAMTGYVWDARLHKLPIKDVEPATTSWAHLQGLQANLALAEKGVKTKRKRAKFRKW